MDMNSLFSGNRLSLMLACFLSFTVVTHTDAASLKGQAPNFTLKSLGGKNLKLSEMTGNVVLINFWASWCGPCREEMPLLNDLHKKYEPLGFTVLGVNVEEDARNARGFLKNFPVDFPVVLDSKNQVSKKYNVIAMPTTVVVDRDGNMRFLHKGYKPGDEEKYRKMVKKLVRE
jgi:thiol-disulfide isomerase/thioredoxin